MNRDVMHAMAACYGRVLWLHAIVACCGCMLWLHAMVACYGCLSELSCSIAWDTMLCYDALSCGSSGTTVISITSVMMINSSADCPSSACRVRKRASEEGARLRLCCGPSQWHARCYGSV